MPIPGVETFEPDGAMPWPLTLVEGEEHSGKTWDLVVFLKQCDKIGEAYWIALDESGHARMYGGRLPGKPFELVRLKTGDYNEVLDVVRKIKAHAEAQHAAGEKPVALVIDTISGIWAGLHDWVNSRHRETRGVKRLLADDPNADVGRAGRNLWNDAEARWTALVRELKTFPGLVIVSARGKEISATDPQTGQPAVDERKKPIRTWSVETHKEFKFYVDVWLRKRREEGSFVVGVRSVEHGKKPGSPEAKEVEPILAPEAEGREIEWLLFDILGLDPKTAYVNDFTEFHAGGFTAGELAELEAANRSENARIGGQSQNGRVNGNGNGHVNGNGRPAKPTVKQAVDRIQELTDPDGQAREVWTVLNVHGMLGIESGVEGYTLEELLVGKRDQLLEKARQELEAAKGKPPAPAASTAVVEAAWATAEPPAAAKEAAEAQARAQALQPATGPTDPDPVEDCKENAARRGITSSLLTLVDGEDAVAEHFGRPIEQVATRKLRDYVAELIAAQKAPVQ
jgi:hypothetical protein